MASCPHVDGKLMTLIYFLVCLACAYCAHISDLRLCGDKNCEAVLSHARALGKHKENDPVFLNFERNAIIKILSKSAGRREDLWGGEFNGNRGYFPRSMVREFKVEISNPEHIVSTTPIDETKNKVDKIDDIEADETDIGEEEDETEIGDETEIENESVKTEGTEKSEEEQEQQVETKEGVKEIQELDETASDDDEEEGDEDDDDEEDEGYEDGSEVTGESEMEDSDEEDVHIGEKEDKDEHVEFDDDTLLAHKIDKPFIDNIDLKKGDGQIKIHQNEFEDITESETDEKIEKIHDDKKEKETDGDEKKREKTHDNENTKNKEAVHDDEKEESTHGDGKKVHDETKEQKALNDTKEETEHDGKRKDEVYEDKEDEKALDEMKEEEAYKETTHDDENNEKETDDDGKKVAEAHVEKKEMHDDKKEEKAHDDEKKEETVYDDEQKEVEYVENKEKKILDYEETHLQKEEGKAYDEKKFEATCDDENTEKAHVEQKEEKTYDKKKFETANDKKKEENENVNEMNGDKKKEGGRYDESNDRGSYDEKKEKAHDDEMKQEKTRNDENIKETKGDKNKEGDRYDDSKDGNKEMKHGRDELCDKENDKYGDEMQEGDEHEDAKKEGSRFEKEDIPLNETKVKKDDKTAYKQDEIQAEERKSEKLNEQNIPGIKLDTEVNIQNRIMGDFESKHSSVQNSDSLASMEIDKRKENVDAQEEKKIETIDEEMYDESKDAIRLKMEIDELDNKITKEQLGNNRDLESKQKEKMEVDNNKTLEIEEKGGKVGLEDERRDDMLTRTEDHLLPDLNFYAIRELEVSKKLDELKESFSPLNNKCRKEKKEEHLNKFLSARGKDNSIEKDAKTGTGDPSLSEKSTQTDNEVELPETQDCIESKFDVKETEPDSKEEINPTEYTQMNENTDRVEETEHVGIHGSYSPVEMSVAPSKVSDAIHEHTVTELTAEAKNDIEDDVVVIDGTRFPRDILDSEKIEPTPSSVPERSPVFPAVTGDYHLGITAREKSTDRLQTQYKPDIGIVDHHVDPLAKDSIYQPSENDLFGSSEMDKDINENDIGSSTVSLSKSEHGYQPVHDPVRRVQSVADDRMVENTTQMDMLKPELAEPSVDNKPDTYKSAEFVSRKPLAHDITRVTQEGSSVEKVKPPLPPSEFEPLQPLADNSHDTAGVKSSVGEEGKETRRSTGDSGSTWPTVGDEIPLPLLERDIALDRYSHWQDDNGANDDSKGVPTTSLSMQMFSLELVIKGTIDKLPPSLQTFLEQEPLGMSPQITVLVSLITVFVLTMFTCCRLLCKRGSKSKKVDPLVVVHGLEEKLFITTKEKENLEDDLALTKKKITELKNEAECSQSSAGTLKTDLQNYVLHIDALKQTIGCLKDGVADKEREQLENEIKLERNCIKVNEVENQLEGLRTEHQNIDRKYKEAIKDSANKTGEINNLQLQGSNMTDQVHHLETRKQQLLKEAEQWNEKVQELDERLSQAEKEKQRTQDDKAFIENELQVLRDCFLQVKSFEQEEESSQDDGTNFQDKIKAMIDVYRVNATLQKVEEERNLLSKKLEFETQERREMEDQVAQVERKMETHQADKMKAERQCQEAQTKLHILSGYFHEKELELQKELGEHQAVKRMNNDQLGSASEKTKQIEEELDSYRQQTDDLKRELTSAERDFRSQIAANEKKAHENWLTARAAERELKESKHETSVLRHKLTDLERRLFDGPSGIIRPLPTRGMPPPGMLNGPLPPPPGMNRSPVERPGSRNCVHGPPPQGIREDGVPSPADDRYPPPPPDRRPIGPPGPRMPPPPMGRRSPPPFDRRHPPPMDRRSPPHFDRHPPPPGYRPPPPDMLLHPHGPPHPHPRDPFSPPSVRLEPPGMDSQHGERGPSPYSHHPGPGQEKGPPHQQSQV